MVSPFPHQLEQEEEEEEKKEEEDGGNAYIRSVW
jgi:hypothetical protein